MSEIKEITEKTAAVTQLTETLETDPKLLVSSKEKKQKENRWHLRLSYCLVNIR